MRLPCSQIGPLLLLVACASPEVRGPFADFTDPVTSRLRRGLPGLSLREGGVTFLDQEACGALLLEGRTCHGAHPASPYGMVHFAEPGEPVSGIVDYALDPAEAVLFVGHTPPRSRYFSFNHHQYRKALPDGSSVVTFATVAPSLHMLDIATASRPRPHEARGEAFFEDYTAVLFTANATTAERIEQALAPVLADVGLAPGIVNRHPVSYLDEADAAALVASGQRPAEEVFTLSMGHGPAADSFNVVLRVAAPEEEDHPYLDPRTIDAAVFRVTLEEPPAYDPFPWPVLPPPGDTGETQRPVLRAAQEAVVQSLVEHVVPASLQTRELSSLRRRQRSGARCVNLLDTCGANNDDALYHRTEQRLLLPDPEAPASIFVVGVNHTRVAALDPEAPQVTYTSVTLNNFTRGFGIATRLDRELEGSLAYWLDEDELPTDFPLSAEERDAIYVLQFTRDCSASRRRSRDDPGPYCVELHEELLGACLTDKLWVTERVYLNRTSRTAPTATSVHDPVTLAVGPDITWSSVGERAGVGGAWQLSGLPRPAPEQGAWCTVVR